MHRQRDALLCAIAEEQHGLFTYKQALAIGHNSDSIRRRVRSFIWIEIAPKVFKFAGTPDTWRSKLLGACFWAGEGSGASRESAAHLLGLRDFPAGKIEIASISRNRPHGLYFTVRRLDHHLLSELIVVDGIPCTSPRRTILDIAGAKDPRIERALDQMLHEGLCTIGQLWLLYDQEWIRGRRGAAILRTLIEHRTTETAPSNRELERLLRKIIRSRGLPVPRYQPPVRLGDRTIHPDAAYVDLKIAIETDGYSFHSDRESFDNDRKRDMELREAGWIVLRFTWAMLRNDPDYVEQRIRAAISARLSMPSGFQSAINAE